MLSFNKTSTIPAINYIDKYYNANCAKNGLGKGAVSVEHSVVGAWYALYGEERSLIKKLLTEDYPNTSFSYVADTYDYWHNVDVVIPSLKKEILDHNGKFLIRPDSGNMVDIAVKTIQKLWDEFGGTVNSKGYKILDPHIGLIYGDGCSLKNVKAIWSELEKLGFAANNIFYGVGAFCFSAIVEESGKMIMATRDTFGIAMKATYGVIDGKKVQIFKDPKTDESKLKKSHKGCCIVYKNNDEKLVCKDKLSFEESTVASFEGTNLLNTVFYNGEILIEEDFMTIRTRLKEGRVVS
jgi:nicotinamide phosphoribosyltransferase